MPIRPFKTKECKVLIKLKLLLKSTVNFSQVVDMNGALENGLALYIAPSLLIS